MDDGPNGFSWLNTFAYTSFAAIGGFLGHIMRTLDSNLPIKWLRSALEGIAAGFVGLLVMLACNASGATPQWTGVIVGVCGWLGASTTIRILERVVRKKLGLQNTRPAPLEPQDVDRS